MNRTQFWCGLGCGIVLTLLVTQFEISHPVAASDQTKKKTVEPQSAAEPKASEETSGMLYELRTYYTPDGKLDDLNARFRNYTMKLFEKHGMTNIMYWTPVDKPNTLIYVIAHKNKAAADASWAAFRDDPEWKKVAEETQKNGKLVDKVESVYMTATDYSPQK